MTTPIEMIRDALRKEAEKHVQKVVALLTYVGEEVVNQIRNGDISSWIDRTGNLRSSIGYIITIDGETVKSSSFATVKGPDAPQHIEGEKTDYSALNGSSEGRIYANRLASLYDKGIALIVVAGMEYASYVEKLENKVVLAQGEIEARKLVTKMVEQLKNAGQAK